MSSYVDQRKLEKKRERVKVRLKKVYPSFAS